MIKREISTKLLDMSKKFQVISLTGPRQSGKTTLVKELFSYLPYSSLEQPDIKNFALDDPRGFLAQFPEGAILDEVQNAPELFSYIQTIVDENRNIQYILTGSSNFLMMERISQSLAGRVAVQYLLPLSLKELNQSQYPIESADKAVFYGQYPRIFDRNLSPIDFFPGYIQTFVERDVRLIKNIEDLENFVRFIRLCAGRTGQLVNYEKLGDDAGITGKTVKAWLSILKTLFVVYELQPYFKNYRKRIVKSGKLYFYDTGLACSLLGINNENELSTHFLKGALFENLIINEFIKREFNKGFRNYPYFWQDRNRKEIDCLLVRGEKVVPVEIKSSQTMTGSFLDNIRYWKKLTGEPEQTGYVVYGGDKSMNLTDGSFISWRDLDRIQLD